MMAATLPARILIVDDDVETCRLIAELVAAPGRELHQCQTALRLRPLKLGSAQRLDGELERGERCVQLV